MSTLTVAMIVKNEEQFIERVIRNVQPIADEIVITDTGSTDKTLGIIKKFKIRLFHYEWDGDRSRARNFTISQCKSDWILFIDADELIDINHYKKLRQLISDNNRYVAYRVTFRFYLDQRINLENLFKQDGAGYYILYTMIRLFKNRVGIFYSKALYESLEDSLRDRVNRVGNSGIIFHHLDILRAKRKKIEKAKWYHDNVFKNFRRFPDKLETNYELAHYYSLKGKFNEAIKYYQKVLKMKPEYIKAKLGLGLSYVMFGKEGEGMRLIRVCSESNNIHHGEAESYLNTAYKIIASRMQREGKIREINKCSHTISKSKSRA